MRYTEFLQKMRDAELGAGRLEASPTGCRYFDYSAGQPNLYLLMRFKQALTAEFGIEAGFQLYRQAVGRHGGAELRRRPLVSQHSFAAAHGAVFRGLIPGGEPFTLYPPKVIGSGNHRPLHGVSRSFYVACIEAARIRGRSEAIEAGGTCLLDFQETELARINDQLEFDSAIFAAVGQDVAVIAERSPADAIEIDEACTLLGAHTDFFGHWMWEYLPRYVAAVQSGGLPPVPVLIDGHMPPSHRQALELMLAEGATIVEIPALATVTVKRLWCVPNLQYMPLHELSDDCFKWDYVAPPPTRFASVTREMTRRATLALSNDDAPQRVFLARRAFRHRKLVNHRAIEAEAKRRGFAIVYPEDLDFIEQARLLHAARFVIAPEGSALFLLYFAQPGCRLCHLTHPSIEDLAMFDGLLAGKEVDIVVLTGPTVRQHEDHPYYLDYQIDEPGFCRFLDAWLAGDSA